MSLTPYQLEVLLHYYACAGEFPRHAAPAFDGVIAEFIDDGILTTTEHVRKLTHGGPAHYKITDRGKAWLEAMLRVPLPEHRVVYEVLLDGPDGTKVTL